MQNPAKNDLLGFTIEAEKEGFEPPEVLPSTVFKTAAIDHSATSPAAKLTFFLNQRQNLKIIKA